jgi:hypothetical protein
MLSLPIVRQTSVALDARTQRRLAALAKRLLAGEPTLNRIDMFGPRVRPGMCAAPAVFFEDHAEIPLVTETSDLSLEYRSFLLAAKMTSSSLADGDSPSLKLTATRFSVSARVLLLSPNARQLRASFPSPFAVLKIPRRLGHSAEPLTTGN